MHEIIKFSFSFASKNVHTICDSFDIATNVHIFFLTLRTITRTYVDCVYVCLCVANCWVCIGVVNVNELIEQTNKKKGQW